MNEINILKGIFLKEVNIFVKEIRILKISF